MTCVRLYDIITNMKIIQMKILKAIEELIDEKGYSPTVREIGARVGIDQPGITHFHLKKLAEQGLVTWVPEQLRTIRLVNKIGRQ